MAENSDKSGLVENDEIDQENHLHLQHQDHHSPQSLGGGSSAAAAAHLNTNSSGGRLRLCKRDIDGLTIVISCVVVFSLAVTTALVIDIFAGQPQVRPHGAVVSQDAVCSSVGLSILQEQQGNALDAAVATYFCLTVRRPDLVSAGGDCGALLLHRHSEFSSSGSAAHQDSPSYTLPHATSAMNGWCVSPGSFPVNNATAPEGGRAGNKATVGVSRLLTALHQAHQQNGKLSWQAVMQPAVQMATAATGVGQLSDTFWNVLQSLPPDAVPALWRTYSSSGGGGGGTVQPPAVYAKWLSQLAKQGVPKSVNDSAREYVTFLDKHWTAEDVQWMRQPVNFTKELVRVAFKDYWIVTLPAPSLMGALVPAVLRSLALTMDQNASDYHSGITELLTLGQTLLTSLPDNYDRTFNLVNSLDDLWKSWPRDSPMTAAQLPNYTALPDADFRGMANILVMDKDHDFVSLSAGLGSPFGSGLSTPNGIILNNALSQFGAPNSGNPTGPHKQPWTVSSPIVVFNAKRKCGARFLVSGNSANAVTAAAAVVHTVVHAISLVGDASCDAVDCLDLNAAVRYPRESGSINGSALVADCEFTSTDAVRQQLKSNGFVVRVRPANDSLGVVFAAGKVKHEYYVSGDETRSGGVTPKIY